MVVLFIEHILLTLTSESDCFRKWFGVVAAIPITGNMARATKKLLASRAINLDLHERATALARFHNMFRLGHLKAAHCCNLSRAIALHC